MTDYISYFKGMTNPHKEAIFEGHLKSQLLMHNYFVAIPEPDIGDDIWVVKYIGDDYQIYPGQIKSAYTLHLLFNGNVKRYTVNIKRHKLEATLKRKFFYFIGLYDPDCASGLFHIGCIPSSFFLEHWDFLMRARQTTLKNYQAQMKVRINLQFEYHIDDNEYYAFVKPLVRVTNFFRDFDAISQQFPREHNS